MARISHTFTNSQVIRIKEFMQDTNDGVYFLCVSRISDSHVRAEVAMDGSSNDTIERFYSMVNSFESVYKETTRKPTLLQRIKRIIKC